MPIDAKTLGQYGVAAGTAPAMEVTGLEDSTVGFFEDTFEGGTAAAKAQTGMALVAAAGAGIALAYYGDMQMSQKTWLLAAAAGIGSWGVKLYLEGSEG